MFISISDLSCPTKRKFQKSSYERLRDPHLDKWKFDGVLYGMVSEST
jgi:hypothetical protein